MQIEYSVVSKCPNGQYDVEVGYILSLKEASRVARDFKDNYPDKQIEIWKDTIKTETIKIYKPTLGKI